MKKDILVNKIVYIPFYFDEETNKYCFSSKTFDNKTCKQFQKLCLNSLKEGMICNYGEHLETEITYFSFKEYDFYNVNNNVYGAVLLPFDKSFCNVKEYATFILNKYENKNIIPSNMLNKIFKTTVFKTYATIKILEHLVF